MAIIGCNWKGKRKESCWFWTCSHIRLIIIDSPLLLLFVESYHRWETVCTAQHFHQDGQLAELYHVEAVVLRTLYEVQVYQVFPSRSSK